MKERKCNGGSVFGVVDVRDLSVAHMKAIEVPEATCMGDPSSAVATEHLLGKCHHSTWTYTLPHLSACKRQICGQNPMLCKSMP